MTRLLPFLLAVLFAVAHTQSPVPYSNQNQYLLHGLAAGTDSPLKDDWLVNTADPVPAFTAFVAFSYRHLGGEWPIQAVFFLALVGYFLAAWWLVRALPFAPRSPAGWVLWAFAFTSVHCGLLRWASDHFLKADYLWFFQCGLANQYLLGPGLQPSVIGVLLLAAVAAWANGRPVLAAALAAGSTLVHSTHLLPAGMLVAGFVVHLLLQRKWRTAAVSAVVALLLVVPCVWYTLATFAPTDAAAFDRSQHILAEDRIPHHCRPARWFDWVAGVQIAWMLLGLVLLRKTRLFAPLAVAAGLAVAGTAVVLVTNNPTLELLFPWRISAVLVPVSTAAVFAVLASGGRQPPGVFTNQRADAPRSPGLLALFSFALLALPSAAVVYLLGVGYREPAGETELLAHVAATRQPADVYLIPTRFPAKSKDFTGVYSKTFTPPEAVFSDLARFRLATRARLYADFKAIPYRDIEVIEWHRRVGNCQRWYAESDWDTSGVIGEVAEEGVTHVVAPAGKPIKSARLETVYEDPTYRVYRVR